ncbi:hypothetical protein HPB52_015561 [Rhipicephalus sanguineus]|uniref:CCHC-type domain-containing protein n=1 Tax=Rhipicephalus sanguineus TaxID=34632 RepID=A0A9D4T279_RHISA|nr:hypothetical protein HPB52_015561 [Rhipicephalus sanguineus]
MRRVCARCSEPGHMATACSAAYCKRCGVFGHDTEGCTEECKRCGGRHGTRECFRKRSYVAAARGFPIDVGAPSVEAKVTPPTPTNAPDHWEHEEPRERGDARGASTSPAPMAVPPDVVDETSNTSSEVDQGESSGLESGSPESSSDSAEQEVPGTVQSPVTDEPAFPGLDAENFPPLLSEPTSPPNPDELPIVSCGRYVLTDANTGRQTRDPPLRINHQAQLHPPLLPLTPLHCSPGPSPLKGEDGPAGAEPSHPSSLDNKHRRPKMHGLSSDSDAPPTAKSQKLDTPPSGKGHTPPSTRPCRSSSSPHGTSAAFETEPNSETSSRLPRCRETNFRTPLDVSRFRREFQVDAFFSLTTARASGVGVIFVTGRFRQKAFCTFGANGRMLMLDIYVNRKRFRFVNVYAPVTRTNTNNFFQNLHQTLSEPIPHVLLGDFSCVIDSQRDVRGPGRGRSTYQAKELVKVLRHLCLTDVWLHVHGDLFVPTRSSQISASRIDRTYLPDFLLSSVAACEVLSPSADLAGRSDHLPLATTLSGFPGPRSDGQGWHDDSIKRIRERLQESVANAPDMTPLSWERLKEEWRRILQEEGRARKRRITAKMNEILRRIRIVKGAESFTACTRSYVNSLEVEYARLLQRCALRPPKKRDKPANPIVADPNEANRNGSVRITRVKRPDGSSATDPDGISLVFRDYFAALFRDTDHGRGTDEKRLIEEVCRNLVRLEGEETASLGGEATAEEVSIAITSMPPYSAPGTDGLTANFYATFLDVLEGTLLAMVNMVVTRQGKPKSFGEGRIVLLLKEGAPQEEPSAWRPITLLNVDYKIVASLPNNRLKFRLPSILPCAVPGRSMFANLTVSGAELNMTKSNALPFGAFPRGALGNLEVVDAVKVLGIYFCCGGVAETTWQRALERAQAAITRLSLENLTLREKALAAKTTVCAFAYYASRIAVMPTKTATQLSKMIGFFLWEGKPAPVRRTLLQLPESEGGLGLSHVLTTSKVFALKTARALYHAGDYVERGLMRYWCSTNAAFLNADRPLAPLAESPSSFYKSAADTMRMLEKGSRLRR